MTLEIEKKEDGKYYKKVMIPDWEEVNEEQIKENFYKANSLYSKNLKELEDLDLEVTKREDSNAEIEPNLAILKAIMVEEEWLSMSDNTETE